MQITFSPRESWPYDRASILVEADADGKPTWYLRIICSRRFHRHARKP
jgi:hypothetical protein